MRARQARARTKRLGTATRAPCHSRRGASLSSGQGAHGRGGRRSPGRHLDPARGARLGEDMPWISPLALLPPGRLPAVLLVALLLATLLAGGLIAVRSGLAQEEPPEASAETGAEAAAEARSEEHTSELQSLMRISYAVFCLK